MVWHPVMMRLIDPRLFLAATGVFKAFQGRIRMSVWGGGDLNAPLPYT